VVIHPLYGGRDWGGTGFTASAENAEESAEFHVAEELRDGIGWETRERDFDAEARRRGGKRGERIAEMGGRRVPGGVEKVKGLRSAETAEDGSLRAGAEGEDTIDGD
jgi:hypothetical protein